MSSYGYNIVDLCIIAFNLNCIMQLKPFYNIATKVSSRKKCYYFWWSTWLLRTIIVTKFWLGICGVLHISCYEFRVWFIPYLYQCHVVYISCSDLMCFNITHWGRDKMAAISLTTFSIAFSWMKMFEFRLRFHWSLFPRVQLTILQLWLR